MTCPGLPIYLHHDPDPTRVDPAAEARRAIEQGSPRVFGAVLATLTEALVKAAVSAASRSEQRDLDKK